jgi:hypothetical protein
MLPDNASYPGTPAARDSGDGEVSALMRAANAGKVSSLSPVTVPVRATPLLKPDAVDPLGVDPDEYLPEPGPEAAAPGHHHFRSPPDLDHARPPGIDRGEIVDDERRPGVGLDIAVLLRRLYVMASHIEGAELAAVPERGRHHVRLSVGSGGRQSAQPLAGEVFDLCRRQFAHLRIVPYRAAPGATRPPRDADKKPAPP